MISRSSEPVVTDGGREPSRIGSFEISIARDSFCLEVSVVEVIQESRTYYWTVGQVEGENAGNLGFSTAEDLHGLDGKVSRRETDLHSHPE